MMSPAQDQTIDFRHLFSVLWRRKGLVVLSTVVCFSGAFIGLMLVPSVYESRVTLLISDRQLLSTELDMPMGGSRRTESRRDIDEERMARMVGRIRGRPFLEKVVHLLKMEEDPRIRALAAERLADHSEINLEEMTMRILVERLQSRIRFGSLGSGVFQITVGDYSPGDAQILARWISELFVDTSVQSSLDYLKSAHDFGMEQGRVYEDQLRKSEEALAHYKESKIEASLSQNVVNAENISLAEALFKQVTDEAAMSRVRLKSLLTAMPSEGFEAESSDLLNDVDLRSGISALTNGLKDELSRRLASGTSGEWPPQGTYSVRRRELLRQVEPKVEERLPDASAEERAAVVRYVFAAIDAEGNSSAAEFLRQETQAFKRRAQSAPGGEIELAQLAKDVETNRKLLQSFQAYMVASDVSRAMQTTNLGLQMEILDPAQIPLAPSHPNRSQILLAALLLGPFAGAGMAFASETMDSTLRNLDDFARLFPEPILGIAPLLSRKIPQPRRLRRYWIPATVSIVIAITVAFYMNRNTLVPEWTKSAQPIQIVSPE
jgi:succinoglycan biosynthesis transport protein ExoP